MALIGSFRRNDGTGDTYPLDARSSLTFNRTWGVNPDTNILPIAPVSPTFDDVPYDLTIGDGTLNDPIVIQKLYVERYDNGRTADGGTVVNVQVIDKRYKFAECFISGVYNQPDTNGDPTEDTNARRLGEILMAALRQDPYDVMALPDDFYPPKSWAWSNAAEELQLLLSQCACAVSLELDNTLKVVQVGVGNPLPNFPMNVSTTGQQRRRKPDVWCVVGGQLLIQRKFTGLEPVGLDVDGKIRMLKDLSYAPDPTRAYGGFEGSGPKIPDPTIVPAVKGQLKQYTLELFNQSVWKWYRIADDDLNMLYGNNALYHGYLLDHICERAQQGGQISFLPVWVEPHQKSEVKNQAARYATIEYEPDKAGFNLKYDWDADQAVIKFHTQMTSFDDADNQRDGDLKPFRFRLYAAMLARSFDDGTVRLSDFYIRPKPRNISFDGKPRYEAHPESDYKDKSIQTIPHPELVARCVMDDAWLPDSQKYGMEFFNPTTGEGTYGPDKWHLWILNYDELNKYADKRLRQVALQADIVDHATNTYPGIYPYKGDGKIRQIIWTIGDTGAFTQIQWETERPLRFALPYHEKVQRVTASAHNRDQTRYPFESNLTERPRQTNPPNFTEMAQGFEYDRAYCLLSGFAPEMPPFGVCDLQGIDPDTGFHVAYAPTGGLTFIALGPGYGVQSGEPFIALRPKARHKVRCKAPSNGYRVGQYLTVPRANPPTYAFQVTNAITKVRIVNLIRDPDDGTDMRLADYVIAEFE